MKERTNRNRHLVVGMVLSALVAGTLTGCGGTPAAPPEPEPTLTRLPPLPPPGETFDYTQKALTEMTEDDRAAYIEEHYSQPIPDPVSRAPAPVDVFGDSYRHNVAAAPRVIHRSVVERRLYNDDRCWTVIGPGYSPFAERAPSYHRNHHRYVRHNSRYDFPANTLLYGTLGGIIGHQSKDRDKGILIGGTYGLLLDLMRW